MKNNLPLIIITLLSACATPEESGVDLVLFSLLAASSNSTAPVEATTTCSADSTAPITITDPGTDIASHTIGGSSITNYYCYYLYTNDSGSSKNVNVTLKPVNGNTDLAIKNNATPGAGNGGNGLISQCTSVGWSACSTNESTASDSLPMNGVTNGFSFSFAVNAARCNFRTLRHEPGCNFKIDITEM